LGIDPYVATTTFQAEGRVAFAGLTDRHGELGDHDFQDMGVRISVETPEPGTLALLGVALSGLAVARKRRSAKA
jgi:hypothetical protein